jgi:hypothetical protein
MLGAVAFEEHGQVVAVPLMHRKVHGGLWGDALQVV